MITIKFATNGSELIQVEQPVVSSGNINSVAVSVDVDSCWSGYTITAVFANNINRDHYYEVAASNGLYIVPQEALIDECFLYVGFRGTKGNEVLTSTFNKYRVKKGAPKGNTISPGTVAETFDERCEHIESNISDIQADIEEIKSTHKSDISSLKEDLANQIALAIKCETEESELIHIEDSADYELQELHIYGKSTQDGTPTPENPIEIVSVENPKVSVYGKNLLKNIAITETINGVTFTVNEDKTITINGTATGNVLYRINTISYTDEVTGIATLCDDMILSGGHQQALLLLCQKSTNIINKGNGVVTKVPKGSCFDARISISSGQTLKDVVIKPQVERGSAATDYEPYKEQSHQFTTTLNGIGDVRDELIVRADGSGQLIKRINKIVLNGSENWQQYKENVYWMSCDDGKAGPLSSLCSAFINEKYVYDKVDKVGYYADHDSLKRKYFVTDKSNLSDFKAWLAENRPIFVYKLETPIITEISSEQMKSYYHTTNIFTDSNAMLKAKYVADPKTYIDNQILELSAALVDTATMQLLDE